MTRTRFSLFYLAGYLIPTGLLLTFAPQVAFRLLLSNGTYGDVIPRLAGGVTLALGVLVAQMIRHRVEVLYTTTLALRVFLVALLGWLFAMTHDPFFLIVIGVVAIGMTFTFSSVLLDSRARRVDPRPIAAR